MKKIYFWILSIIFMAGVMLANSQPVYAAANGITGGCTWTLNDTDGDGLEDQMIIEKSEDGNGQMEEYSSNWDRPWYSYGQNIKNVIIKEGVTNIGYNAFREFGNLVSVEIPKSVTSIDAQAFMYCSKLKGIKLPTSVVHIGDYAFQGCKSLISVEIPNGVTNIGMRVFEYCENLEILIIPDSVVDIRAGAFNDCTKLTVYCNSGSYTEAFFRKYGGDYVIGYPDSFNVSVDSGGNGIVGASVSSAVKGSKVTLTAKPESGYRFKEWKIIAGEVEILNDSFIMPEEDVKIQAVFEAIYYNVTVESTGDGTVSSSESAAIKGSEITLSTEPDEGYRFKEWKVIEGEVTITDNSFVMPAENVKIQAIFEEIYYSVTVEDDGHGTASVSENNATKETWVTLTAIPNSGYRFKEWKVIEGNVTIIDDSFIMPAENVKIQAVFEAIYYSVTVEDDGCGTASASTSSAIKGTTVTLMAKPQEGYRFKVWKVVEGKVTITNDSFIMPAEDVKIQAVFEAINYSVTVESTGHGTARATTNSATKGRKVTLNVVPESGYRFKEWKVIEGEVTITNDSFVMPAEDVKIQAVFEAIYYNVTVESTGDGTVSTSESAAIKGSKITLIAEPDEGYRFKEWKVIEGGVTITNDSFIMPAKDVKIQAVFEPIRYNIMVESAGHGTASASVSNAANGIEITLIAEPDEGYRFKEWKVIEGEVTITNDSFVMPAEDVKIQAVFEAIYYNVTVESTGDGTVSASESTAIKGSEITLSTEPNEGYRFKEWKVIAGEMTILNDSFIMPAGDVKIQAVFEAIRYNVIVESIGHGTASASESTAAKGSEITLNAIPESGYCFKGWKVIAGKVEILNDSFIMPTEEVIIQAIFEEEKNEVARISGKSRYETGYKVSDALKETLGVEKFDAVVVATGKNFADALAGSYLAVQKNAPIILTNGKDDNIAQLHEYIEANVAAGGKVYILGGEGAVPAAVAAIDGYDVVRLSGKSRYETNLAILAEAGVAGDSIIVATGKSFADSLSASAAKLPILLVKPGEVLSEDAKAVLNGMKNIYIIGGEGAVSAEIAAELAAFGEVTRVAGKSRYETSVAVAKTFFVTVENAVVASGKNFPDGLCGGPLAAAMNAPLILTADGKTEAAAGYMAENAITAGYVLGGTGALADESVVNVFALISTEDIVLK